ncbi:hypothetical protein L226DRAFT_557862 [Lentinus tigrinus ALCF2SS1-7]|uniref:F-box domain-containing protein n=1 Tax=Lentinus tigrinus ALCF2SS1-6 TaxID=1328759 RepID=A0A5C2SPY9_9APHY|nr:hypothetical protein L227DRAFT_649514 [Lentinus tigrinus ALCF2SS1-6]RPD79188.1 hypothetical protein L226DRAFT_557862 [Lentinus tigrinus ALCF2SS1-7]
MNTATSRFLANSDVFYQLATEVYRTPGEWRSLAALAATSRTLHDIVLPVLWQELHSLVPLLRLLPLNTWTESLNSANQMIFRLTTSENLDWTRFAKYACHVRRFTWHECMDVSVSTLIKMSLAKPLDCSLLPHLRSLVVRDTRDHYVSELPVLFSPSLIDLRLIWHVSYLPDKLLEGVHKTCPQLEELHLSPLVTPDTVLFLTDVYDSTQDILMRCITGMPDLRKLYCSIPLSTATFKVFAAHPRLQEVAVPLSRRTLKDIAGLLDGDVGAPAWFPDLLNFDLTVDEVNEDMTALVASFHQSLQRLSVRTVIHPSTSDLQLLTESMARSAYVETLAELCIRFDSNPNSIQDRYPSYLDFPTVDIGKALNPMLRRQSLRRLHVEGDYVSVSDGDLARIAELYPSLRSLTVLGRESPEALCPSVCSLVMIAQKFPDLMELDLRYSGTESDIPSQANLDRLQVPSPSTHPLKIFQVNGSSLTTTCKGALALTKFISRMFPKAALIIKLAGSEVPKELPEPWGEVNKHLLAEAMDTAQD